MVLPGATDNEASDADEEPTNVPPQLPLYHFQVAPVPNVPPVCLNVTEVPEQIESGFALFAVAPVGATEAVQGLRAIKIAPLPLTLALLVAVPEPVAPIVAFKLRAAPTLAAAAELTLLS